MGGRSRALAKCHIVIAGSYKEYPAAKVSGWIANLGGSVQTRPNENTTHVVASVNAWNRKDASIQKAQELNEERATRDVIKIVSFDWLVDCADNKTKKREGPYLCEKLYVSASKRDAAKKRQEGADGKEKKGHVGMMAEVFQESTEGFVDDRERKRVEKQIETEKRVREEMEREERDDQRKKTAELFGKGAKKARNEIFTENHHIYTDDTGFKYDILLTKVDTRQNRNERVALTVSPTHPNGIPSPPLPLPLQQLVHIDRSHPNHPPNTPSSRSTNPTPSPTPTRPTANSPAQSAKPKTSSSSPSEHRSPQPSGLSAKSSKRGRGSSGMIGSPMR